MAGEERGRTPILSDLKNVKGDLLSSQSKD